MSNQKFLYRCELRNFEEIFNPILKFITYSIIKETKCGFWIMPYANGPKKFVLFGSGKRFAHTSKELALDYFIARRRFYGRLLKTQIKRNNMALELAGEYLKDINHIPEQQSYF